jgi:hypothetical protein
MLHRRNSRRHRGRARNIGRWPDGLQLFHDPGELGKIGQIWFVESLGDDEARTGRRLRENLQDLLVARLMKLRLIRGPGGAGWERYRRDGLALSVTEQPLAASLNPSRSERKVGAYRGRHDKAAARAG